MKIILVVKSKQIEVLGPMYLQAVAKQAGHDCIIVDIDEAFNSATVCKPDIIGYSVMTGDTLRFKTLNQNLKKVIEFTSVWGGPDPTFFPKGYQDDDDINIVIPGEAEQEWAELLESSKKYPDLNSIPTPDRTDFPNHKIRDFITSRGCPFSCSYCFNTKWMQLFPELGKVRTREVRPVINEILEVNPDFVYFQDSCFGVNTSWLREFSSMYRRLVNIPFHCHLRPIQVEQERVLLLHDAHCISVRIALETVSPRLLKLLNREKTDLDQVKNAVRLLKKWNIKLMIQNMIGLPTGTIEDDLQTLEFNIQCRPAYGWVSIFQPYPGTSLGDLSKKNGWYTEDYSEITDCFFDGSVMEFSELYKTQLQVLQKIWALSVETGIMPAISELSHEGFPKLVHRMTRAVGDKRLYGGVI